MDSNKMLVRLWIFCAILTVVGSLIPRTVHQGTRTIEIGDPVQRSTGMTDKPQHFLAYSIMAFLPALAFAGSRGYLIGGSMIALGIGIEFVQLLTPDRNFEVADMAANTLGVATGLALAVIFKRLRSMAAERQVATVPAIKAE